MITSYKKGLIRKSMQRGMGNKEVIEKYEITQHEAQTIKKTIFTYKDGDKTIKICGCCLNHKENTLENFYKSKNNKDGLENKCKACRYRIKLNYRIMNREKTREQEKRYNGKSKKYTITEEQRNENIIKCRKYYKKNRKKVLEKQSDYYFKRKLGTQ